jgi:DNA-binding transcriptional LysR family regulator
MRAIPIDVLRAFVAVVDSRGFTRAAEDLGRTQPTVSLQVKRLEELIEAPLFEKASRLILTRSGEICLDYGRKILAQHDEMLDFVVRQRSGSDPIRLGMPSEFAAFLVPNLASLTRRDGQRLHFDFTCEMSETLLDRLRANQLDVALALMSDGGAEDAVAEWRLPMGWISAPGYQAPKDSPVQLITTPERSLYYQIATAAASRRTEIRNRMQEREFRRVEDRRRFRVRRFRHRQGVGAQGLATRPVRADRRSAGRHSRSVRARRRGVAALATARRTHDRRPEHFPGARPHLSPNYPVLSFRSQKDARVRGPCELRCPALPCHPRFFSLPRCSRR